MEVAAQQDLQLQLQQQDTVYQNETDPITYDNVSDIPEYNRVLVPTPDGEKFNCYGIGPLLTWLNMRNSDPLTGIPFSRQQLQAIGRAATERQTRFKNLFGVYFQKQDAGTRYVSNLQLNGNYSDVSITITTSKPLETDLQRALAYNMLLQTLQSYESSKSLSFLYSLRRQFLKLILMEEERGAEKVAAPKISIIGLTRETDETGLKHTFRVQYQTAGYKMRSVIPLARQLILSIIMLILTRNASQLATSQVLVPAVYSYLLYEEGSVDRAKALLGSSSEYALMLVAIVYIVFSFIITVLTLRLPSFAVQPVTATQTVDQITYSTSSFKCIETFTGYELRQYNLYAKLFLYLANPYKQKLLPLQDEELLQSLVAQSSVPQIPDVVKNAMLTDEERDLQARREVEERDMQLLMNQAVNQALRARAARLLGGSDSSLEWNEQLVANLIKTL